MPQSDYVHLDDCRILALTESAILVLYDGEKIWFPKSQVADADEFEVDEDDDVTVSITEWLARQKGIET